MNPPAKLSDLIMTLEMESEEFNCYFDRKTGQTVALWSNILRALEDGDEEALEDLPEWQKKEVEIAREFVKDDGTRFVPGPDKFDFHEYHQMERFIQSLDDEEAANQLGCAIKGRGAFRYFKDTLHRLKMQNAWHQFLDDALKQFVIDWAKENHVPYVDDSIKPSRKS
jgi:hypothetical protein